MLALAACGSAYPCGGVSVSVWRMCWWRRMRSACVRAGWDDGGTETRSVRAVCVCVCGMRVCVYVCVCVCVSVCVEMFCKCINGKEYSGRQLHPALVYVWVWVCPTGMRPGNETGHEDLGMRLTHKVSLEIAHWVSTNRKCSK